MAVAVPEPLPSTADSAPRGQLHKVGTLRYTGFALFTVCFWLLWGDFVGTLLDGSLGRIFPLKLKDMGASDFTIQMLCQTLARATAFAFAPIVSFRSDRYRSRWGRRIPFLAWTTPLVGAFLILIGCYDGVANVLTGGADSLSILGYVIPAKTVAIVTMGVLLFGYDFANIFAGTVYYYLFNDVVPEQFLSRFLSLFRMVGIGAGMLYNYFIFPHSMSHFRTIFVIAGIAYTVGYLFMCFFIKEGKYPPAPPNVDKRTGIVSSIKTFAKECFTHRFYWYFFLGSTFRFMSGSIIGSFMLLRDKESLGLTLEQLGVVAAWTGGVSFILQYPCGWLSDRWNPIRVHVFSSVLSILGTLASCIWIFTDFGVKGNLHYYYWTAMIFLPIVSISDAAEGPMYMRLLPKERYGQFCSANAMIRSFAMIFGSLVLGYVMQKLGDWTSMGDWRYRYTVIWALVFQIPSCVFLVLLYKSWKARGGNHGYTPPAVA